MLIFIDLETTGLDIEDKVCSIGLIVVDGDSVLSKYELVNEGKKIPPKASSINHITNEMIKGRVSLKESEIWKFLQEHSDKGTTIVGHNIGFDLNMLASSGFTWHGGIIDTLRAARHLIEECDGFALQHLRYELKLYMYENDEALRCGVKPEEIRAHNALSDALHVKMLYEYLSSIKSREELIRLSSENVLLSKFDFGKYNGRYIEEICMYDRRYVVWLLENAQDLDEDLRYTIQRYINP